ncbi:LIC_10190 family membrane protein [Aridibaculum aurantiacum]|uniref:LIC_10190 family membrane protein n=1 Tax=Aridibaculum aurantiacum TaxID=2810307 RepID=UPI001A975588|nr:hypothetical protein [Aridibaculum aurantiacum]
MILLLGSALLFWLVVSVIGNVVCKNILQYTPGLFMQFVAGFVAVTTVCNLLSFVIPVDQYVALGLVGVSVLFYKSAFSVFDQWRQATHSMNRLYLLLSVAFAAVLFSNLLLPPQHVDSQGYHFHTALWIEKYKIIPGLVNLHGRYGFNSSFFTPTAAFSFTAWAGQSLYVVNFVFIAMFYGWLISKGNRAFGSWHQLVYLVAALYLFRALLVGTNSPTPDAIASIIVVWVFIVVAEYAVGLVQLSKQEAVLLIIAAAFSLTVKLNTAPLILPAVYLFVKQGLYKNAKQISGLAIAVAAVVVPWLMRNFIISGYFAYPVAFTGFLQPDWQVPEEMLRFDKLLINNGPKLISEDWEAVDKLPFWEWMPQWVMAHYTPGSLVSLAGVFVSVAVGIAGIIIMARQRKQASLLVALMVFSGLMFWLFNSPDYRFGFPYMISVIAVSLLPFLYNKQISKSHKKLMAVVVVSICLFYTGKTVYMLSAYDFSSYVVKPLKQEDYFRRNDISTFKTLILGDGVVLYLDDVDHNCINAPLPCYPRHFPGLSPTQVRLRGKTIEEGFRTEKK